MNNCSNKNRHSSNNNNNNKKKIIDTRMAINAFYHARNELKKSFLTIACGHLSHSG